MAKKRKKKRTVTAATRARRDREQRAKDLAVATDVWLAFERCRSIRGTAIDTGQPEERVREILNADEARLKVIAAEFQQACVAEWEKKEVASHGIMDRCLNVYAGILAEIEAATEDDRLTTIRDQDGHPLPVVNAMQLVLACRMIDQVTKIAQVARGISDAYQGSEGGPGRLNGAAADDDPEKWPEQRFIDLLRAGGLRVPKAMKRKVDNLLEGP